MNVNTFARQLNSGIGWKFLHTKEKIFLITVGGAVKEKRAGGERKGKGEKENEWEEKKKKDE